VLLMVLSVAGVFYSTGQEEIMKEMKIEYVGKLECVSKVCNLGDTIGSSGGAEEASRARVWCAGGKFRGLASILTSRGAYLKVKGKMCSVCVPYVVTWGSETWPMRMEDLRRLERADKMTIRRMCGVTLRNEKASEEIKNRLAIERF
jgi:hypothetical protein